ncbi:MAG TPA: electron transport complex subunit RsxB [Burkholderiaceae bacterium]|nr:electron transport complex subunit RsxB [Burkholderiaceae bacterium]
MNPLSVEAVDALLPQTQCTRCGYPDCHGYAAAIARGEADINRCPPGGAEGIERLARLTGRPARPLDPSCGAEGPRTVAVIDEAWCIGCTLCIKACPVDCIVGTHKRMHTVVEDWCTGCELCVPVCPVDCITLRVETPGRTGWAAWNPAQAGAARARYDFHRMRVERDKREHEERLAAKAEHKLEHLEEETKLTAPDEIARKRAVIDAALQRARARLGKAG